MRDAGQSEIETVTLSFEEFQGSANDEAPIAEQVARTYGTQHTTRVVTKAEFEADLPRILAAMDQPSIDGINTWFVSKAARERGLKGRNLGRRRRRVAGWLLLVPGHSQMGVVACRTRCGAGTWRSRPTDRNGDRAGAVEAKS